MHVGRVSTATEQIWSTRQDWLHLCTRAAVLMLVQTRRYRHDMCTDR